MSDLSWRHDLDKPYFRVKPNTIFSDEPLTFTVNLEPPQDEWKQLRVHVFGLPACPVRHKHFSSKTFKKALMAHGWSRDKAEYMCRLVKQAKGVLCYDSIAKHACPWIFT